MSETRCPSSIETPSSIVAGYLINRQRVCSEPRRHLVFVAIQHDHIERSVHIILQLLTYLCRPPEKSRAVLNPFKIIDGRTACIGQNVRNDHDAAFFQNSVGL